MGAISCTSKETIAPPHPRRLRFFSMKNRADVIFCVLLLATPLFFAQSPAPIPDALAPTLNSKSAVDIDREWQESVAKYDGERKRLLSIEQQQENDGPYRADWETLRKHHQPAGNKDPKSGTLL